MKRLVALLVLVLLSALPRPVRAESSADPAPAETPAERDARMAWWREARFGLSIHWGVSAVPAGRYRDRPVEGSAEWIMHTARIPVAEYREYGQLFAAEKYDPEAWVALAKRAGMKYILITAKHLDGFALFDSAVTDWDVADATPHRKDLLRPLLETAHDEGLKVGVHYSQAQDWVHPGGAKAGYEDGQGWDEEHKGSFDTYLREIAVPQVRELLTGYPIDLLSWESMQLMTAERAAPLAELLRLRPGIIQNNRLGGGIAGDIESFAQTIPARGPEGRDWEVCMSLNDSWGFKRDDRNGKPADVLIRNLVDVASKGGNFLLSVAPTSEGRIPNPGVERLEAVGRWMAENGESIHGTTASPFLRLPWGRCTQKRVGEGATLYLHIFEWPTDGILRIPGVRSEPRAVRVLGTGAELEWRSRDDGLQVGLPLVAPDAACSVLAVEFNAPPEVEAITLKQGADGRVILPAAMAELMNPGRGSQLKLEQKEGPGRYNIGAWSDPRAWVRWTFKVARPGAFDLSLEFANPSDGSRLHVRIGEQKISATLGTTGGWGTFKEAPIGRVRLDRVGTYELSIRPDLREWRAINLCEAVLTPVR